ncbi:MULTISPECIES: IclR family transcriptional regulator [Microbacterium]|uniref:IclR family transcriptional regulator n=1 Tax=Microbacterium TaxID=33882 RepID=UPI00278174EC|nr:MULTISPECIES: IclR family transcriptional regulator [Microbacterium]MDQ1084433.1 DNA-binding IclR family transcriptional regulator [Microbacterium sp. SORGH_AS_0344]MDQ1170292.1 DNA-binding IclR family transcriptional regulator [Microbacterium proteolyticum]
MSVDDASALARDPAPAVGRSIRLLEMLAEAGRALTLTELASGLGLAKSSTANLCLSLEGGRMIERVASGYRLGIRTAELGGAFAAQFNQIREFYAVCESSPVLARELVQVAMLDDLDALYLARYEGSRSVRLGTPLGSRLPAALSATGRALLMTRDDETVRDLLSRARPLPQLTEHSTVDVDGVLAKLAAARTRGWSVDEEESFRGIVGVAVPLEGWAPGDPQLALGVGIPVADAVPERLERVGAALREAAAALTNPFSASRSA